MSQHSDLVKTAKQSIAFVFLDGSVAPNRTETSLLELLDTINECLRKLGRPAKQLKH